MRIESDAWLTDAVGYGVFRIGLEAPIDLTGLVRHNAAQARALYYVKLPTSGVAELRALCGHGFYLVDTALSYEHRAGVACEQPHAAVELREVQPSDDEALLEVARTSFRYSRFHRDPLLEPGIADRLKRAWCENLLSGRRGDRVFVALIDRVPVGFLGALCWQEAGRTIALIDLIAIAGAHQGKGIGRALTGEFMRYYTGRGALLRVGTQAVNVPSLRLYGSLGFLLRTSEYVAHLHVADGKVMR